MASATSPFADPERDNTLPAVPSSLLITQASGTMDPQPITRRQPSSNQSAENPFADPSRELKSNFASSVTSFPSDSRSATRGNHSQNRTATRDFTSAMTGDPLTRDTKPSSSKSTASTAPSSSRTGTSTLICSIHDGVTSAANNRNPFADPRAQPRNQDRGHVGTGTGPATPFPRSIGTPLCSHYTTPTGRAQYMGSVPSGSSSIGPAPPPKSPLRKLGPLGANRWTSISAFTDRISSTLHPQGNDSVNSFAKQAVALDSAHHQDILLAVERAKASGSHPNLKDPQLRPSPSAIRLAAELIRARDAKNVYHSHVVLTSMPFWVGVIWAQCGLVSTTAAVAVVLEDRQNGTKANIGNSKIFWLTLSTVALVLGCGITSFIWIRKKGAGFCGSDQSILNRLGCDEVGLLNRAVGDLEMGRIEAFGEEEERESAPSRQESFRRRQRGPVPSTESLRPIRTTDPEWQAMYPCPKELKKVVSWETIGDTPVRRGAHGLHKDSNLTRSYNEQRSKPPPQKNQPKLKNQQLSSSSCRQKREKQHFNEQSRYYMDQRAAASGGQIIFEKQGKQTLTRSDISWPLRSSPNAQPYVNIHPEYPSFQTSVPASYQGLPQQYSTNPYPSNLGMLKPSADPFPNLSALKTEPNNHARAGTESRVEVLSPLSSLKQILHDASQSSLPPHHHPEYIHGHRVASEERVRSLRQSLDQSHGRGQSAGRDLARVQSTTLSAATERLREYVAEVKGESEEDGRVGRPRSRSVRVVLEKSPIKYAAEEKEAEAYNRKTGVALTKGRSHSQVKEQPRCRSLGEVVREKMAQLKEAGVESEPKPAVPPRSPLRDRET
ncbi:hypothetical protein ONS95_006985 [Cadophora gregata]|uniref:uncharacterized protein n=1 Tax=Cadophora gregata TaxID=51156 RepID=UPI0026DBED92|nr:uncharacterized protein ONS95_006985 [Cadophora gregata]KAK0100524.1 hypothetical protein ONS95_006985 [Cadophora gregata]KAK0117476.1 hypothetical protein ONS96_013306 [Cadophora gregata f. sp. sojae]